jgi:hypothetical protein
MPHLSNPVELPVPVRNLYMRIANLKGSPSGCFDVVAWKDARIVWLEYKGPNDKSNQNEALWIDAALRAGVRAEDMVFVGDTARGSAPTRVKSFDSAPLTRPVPAEKVARAPSPELQSENAGIYEPMDDRDYYGWLSSHPAGYVLSLKGKREPMLHRSDCSHIDRNNNTITKARKICSEDRRALGDWVRRNGLGNGIVLNKCRSCSP